MNKKIKKPPQLAEWLLEFMAPDRFTRTAPGDFEEIFHIRYQENSLLYAQLWYWIQIIRSLPTFISETFRGSLGMLRNYFKIAFRNLVRHKGFSFLNISGLAMGIACSVLIMLFVQDELSYDSHYENSDRIYRVAVDALIGKTKIDQVSTPSILPPTLKKEFPEVEEAITLSGFPVAPVKYLEKSFNESSIFFSDTAYFDVFSHQFLLGDKETALAKPQTVVITKSTAEKYFGDENPIGKIFYIRDSDYTVTGVVTDVPENSHFHFDFMASIVTFDEYPSTGWWQNNYTTYIVLREGFPYQELDAKLPEFVERNLYEGMMPTDGGYWRYYLQPLTDIHLTSDLSGEHEPNGKKSYVYMFFIISFFILVIACVNFMNLTTARSTIRAREIGIRKVVGSHRSQLIKQFLAESILMSAISTSVALILIETLLPTYNNFIGKQLDLDYGSSFVLPGLMALMLVVGIFSGSYPAFFLSSFKPLTVIKSHASSKGSSALLRNSLVIFQFSISIFLIIGTMVVANQLEHIQNSRLGFNKEQVLVVRNVRYLSDNRDSFRQELLQSAAITDASYSSAIPGINHNNWGMKPEGLDGITLNVSVTDTEFMNTLKLEMAEGRFFSGDMKTDSASIVINESAVKILDWEDPIGQQIDVWWQPGLRKTIIGVVKDYHYESKRMSVRPLGILTYNGIDVNPRYLSLRMNTDNIQGTMQFVEEQWKSFLPDIEYEYSFLEEDYDGLYANEQQTGSVFMLFSIIAIAIASLGLFGLASFTVEQRTKEIGIRKVLGASMPNIVLLFSREFMKWMAIAILIAWPAGWFAMNAWLEDFAFRIDLEPWTFLLSGILAMTIALLTISFQAIKAARAQPVDSLNYE